MSLTMTVEKKMVGCGLWSDVWLVWLPRYNTEFG